MLVAMENSNMTEFEVDRYFYHSEGSATTDQPVKLKYFVNGQWHRSTSDNFMPCYNPSTGEIIAYAPQCTAEEVESAILAAKQAYPGWANTPVGKRVQVLFKMKTLLEEHFQELTHLLAKEQGKKWDEASGDVVKVLEVIEFACGAPHLMKGESLMNVSTGYDTVQFRHPIGVFAGIAPWNFPAMIPHGWMAPICIATGNCMVLKAASFVPPILDAIDGAVARSRFACGSTKRRHRRSKRSGNSAPAS